MTDAKFGIFIHWGVYSVPAWAPTTGTLNYAESYQWVQHVPNSTASQTWVHHKDTYGTNVTYEDFIPQWNADEWDPKDWLNLFMDAGAKYFVLTSKHHDGFSLFDTGKTSNRSSTNLGPMRDLVGELLGAAKQAPYKDSLVGSVYYSMPEWLNPDYAPYGFGSWPGGQAHNAYDYSLLEPYTGWIPVNDYIDDLQTPQMETLLFDVRYGSPILWCDIGGPSKMLGLAAKFYNTYAKRGQQVVLNDRCSIKEADMLTPELMKFSSILERKWEACEGLDPHSFGYNANRVWSEYKNSTTVLVSLFHVVCLTTEIISSI
ncbi:glycoside hydrolase superfamily [Flagelloscypha sp. PMI_526]|nr:glycoside hydrolase superfamily [Flagelloscypha sp. PMI_526]